MHTHTHTQRQTDGQTIMELNEQRASENVDDGEQHAARTPDDKLSLSAFWTSFMKLQRSLRMVIHSDNDLQK